MTGTSHIGNGTYESVMSRVSPGEIRLSVVVPVFNVKHYVEDTLASIIAALPANDEIIVVDDGSTDGSFEAVVAWVNKNNFNVQLLKGPNCGLGAARNAGARVATGKYIAFFDSDDLAISSTYNTMVNLSEKNCLDMIIARSRSFDNVTLESFPFGDSATIDRILGKNQFIITNYLRNGSIFRVEPSAPPRIYLRHFFNVSVEKFPVGRIFEDFVPHVRAMARAGRIGFLNEFLLNYRVGRRGQLTATRSPKRLDIIHSIQEVSRLSELPKLTDLAGSHVCGAIARITRWCATECPRYLIEEFFISYVEAIKPIHRHWWIDYAQNYTSCALEQTFCIDSANLDIVALKRSILGNVYESVVEDNPEEVLFDEQVSPLNARTSQPNQTETSPEELGVSAVRPVSYAKHTLAPQLKSGVHTLKRRFGF